MQAACPILPTCDTPKSRRAQYLTDVFNSVQLKDVVKRNMVRDVDLLERILAYVMANVGTTFSRPLSPVF